MVLTTSAEDNQDSHDKSDDQQEQALIGLEAKTKAKRTETGSEEITCGDDRPGQAGGRGEETDVINDKELSESIFGSDENEGQNDHENRKDSHNKIEHEAKKHEGNTKKGKCKENEKDTDNLDIGGARQQGRIIQTSTQAEMHHPRKSNAKAKAVANETGGRREKGKSAEKRKRQSEELDELDESNEGGDEHENEEEDEGDNSDYNKEDVLSKPKKQKIHIKVEENKAPTKDPKKEAAGKDQIHNFLKNPANGIPHVTRVYIQENADHLPEAGLVSAKLGLHCLTTNRNNTFCLYHKGTDKVGSKAGESSKKYKITGTPEACHANQKKGDGVQAPPGHLNCGCPIDAALFDFFIWKFMRATDKDSNHQESMIDEHIHPHLQYFLYDTLRSFGITMDHLYSLKQGDREAQKQVLREISSRTVEELKRLNSSNGNTNEVFGNDNDNNKDEMSDMDDSDTN
ncbi:hypothetical protein SERLA73DRAFT_150496 [Serpula lacrymans var. lacrymans S7.3]|uniref:Uncharacterized protein n=1 Tax=Serpula lacrymans var. lacrymans (strain S7.3) TaxID=936435 RepID=F8PMS9_SERL3|nr:hypothetical protein SERLA73DRAFT_150496 [Serpula lacrymans var. lacrymans S7.3]